MRRVFVMTLALAALLIASPEALACSRCGWKLDCSIDPDCILVLGCKPTAYPTRGFSDCDATADTCTNGGDLCFWTDLRTSEWDLMALLDGENLSAAEPGDQCPSVRFPSTQTQRNS